MGLDPGRPAAPSLQLRGPTDAGAFLEEGLSCRQTAQTPHDHTQAKSLGLGSHMQVWVSPAPGSLEHQGGEGDHGSFSLAHPQDPGHPTQSPTATSAHTGPWSQHAHRTPGPSGRAGRASPLPLAGPGERLPRPLVEDGPLHSEHCAAMPRVGDEPRDLRGNPLCGFRPVPPWASVSPPRDWGHAAFLAFLAGLCEGGAVPAAPMASWGPAEPCARHDRRSQEGIYEGSRVLRHGRA